MNVRSIFPKKREKREKEISPRDGNFRRERERERRAGEEESEDEERENEERERMNKYVDKTWQPRGGRNNKIVHLSGNADVVPQKFMPLKDVYPHLYFIYMSSLRCLTVLLTK